MGIRKDLNGLLLSNSDGLWFLVEGGQRRGLLLNPSHLFLPSAKPVTPNDHPTLIGQIDENAPLLEDAQLIANPAGTVCLQEGNGKRYVSEIAFAQYHFDFSRVKPVSESEFAGLVTGPPIEERHDGHKLWERVPFRPGDVLISPNSRFRLKFEPGGYLALWGYDVEYGKRLLRNFGNVDGKPAVLLRVPQQGNAVLVAADGSERVFLPRHWAIQENVCVVVEDNPNVVFWGASGGHMAVHSHTSTHDFGKNAKLVAPNTATCEIPATTGTVGVFSDPDGYIYNSTEKPIGVRNGDRYDTLPAKDQIAIAQIGNVTIEVPEYRFASLHDDGTPPTKPHRYMSGDGSKAHASRGPGGERFTFDVIKGITGDFTLRLVQPMEGAESVSEGIDLAELLRHRTCSDEMQ